jgi:hypothetical protein
MESRGVEGQFVFVVEANGCELLLVYSFGQPVHIE